MHCLNGLKNGFLHESCVIENMLRLAHYIWKHCASSIQTRTIMTQLQEENNLLEYNFKQ